MKALKPGSLDRLVLKLRTIQTLSSRLRRLEESTEERDLQISESSKPDEDGVQDLFRLLLELQESINLVEIQISQLQNRLSSIEEITHS